MTHNPSSCVAVRICVACGYTFEKKINYFLFCKRAVPMRSVFTVKLYAVCKYRWFILYWEILWLMSPESGPGSLWLYLHGQNPHSLIPHLQPTNSFLSSCSQFLQPLSSYLFKSHPPKAQHRTNLHTSHTVHSAVRCLSRPETFSLLLSSFLPSLHLSSCLEESETAVNYSATASQGCRQPSSLFHAGADRQGGHAGLDILEKGNRGVPVPPLD